MKNTKQEIITAKVLMPGDIFAIQSNQDLVFIACEEKDSNIISRIIGSSEPSIVGKTKKIPTSSEIAILRPELLQLLRLQVNTRFVLVDEGSEHFSHKYRICILSRRSKTSVYPVSIPSAKPNDQEVGISKLSLVLPLPAQVNN